MMRGLVASLEKHHNVRILDEAVYASVRLSHRFLAGRQLPDKAVSILDTACARLSLGQNATPPAIEDLTRQIDALEGSEAHPRPGRSRRSGSSGEARRHRNPEGSGRRTAQDPAGALGQGARTRRQNSRPAQQARSQSREARCNRPSSGPG